jgi:cell wall assembly regulator SMI1
MDIINKIQEIVNVQKSQSNEKFGDFNSPVSDKQILQIEELLEENLPSEFKLLYSFAHGQNSNGRGILCGEKFMSAEEIIGQLKESRKFIKPVNRIIGQPEKSEELIKKIVAFYLSKAPRSKFLGLKPSWFKMELSCSADAYNGPYLYKNENAKRGEYAILEIDPKEYEAIETVIQELYRLEEESYNWDELNFIIYQTGKYEVKRSDYDDLHDESLFSSSPEAAIKKKYFHHKWVPVFSDYSGNYIGIDLDPDTNGIKGQIINFGRDEADMFVIANNIEDFFDFFLSESKKSNSELLSSDFRLHEVLRELKKR